MKIFLGKHFIYKMFLSLLLDILTTFTISYGSFILAYKYTLIKFQENPPSTINGEKVDDRWYTTITTLHRVPFKYLSGTVINHMVEMDTIYSKTPSVHPESIRIQKYDSWEMTELDMVFLTFSLVSAGRSLLIYWLFMGLYVSIAVLAGHSFARIDAVCKYIR